MPEHREVLRDSGIYYVGREDLKEKMIMLMEHPSLVEEKGVRARKIIMSEYTWEKIINDYEKLFSGLIG